jgi:hypothetical protein
METNGSFFVDFRVAANALLPVIGLAGSNKAYSRYADGRKIERAKAAKFDGELKGWRFLFLRVIEASGVRIEFTHPRGGIDLFHALDTEADPDRIGYLSEPPCPELVDGATQNECAL